MKGGFYLTTHGTLEEIDKIEMLVSLGCFLEAFGRKDDFLAGIYQCASKKGRKCAVVGTSLVFGMST